MTVSLLYPHIQCSEPDADRKWLCWKLPKLQLLHSGDKSKLRQYLPEERTDLSSGFTRHGNLQVLGMDSTRGGPLSSFIMMLPLIVVPVIALLRPAERGSSIVSEDLSASAEQAPFSEFDEFGFDDLPGSGESPGIPEKKSADNGLGELDTSEFIPNTPVDPLQNLLTDSSSGADTATQARQIRLQELQRLGASRTIWFTPGSSGQTGFVAFFPTGQGHVTYRFSAIAPTDVQAIDDVLNQVRDWQGIPRATATFPEGNSEIQTGF